MRSDKKMIKLIRKNTAFKKKKRAIAVLETLKWLKEGAPHQFDGLPGTYDFDMSIFINHNGLKGIGYSSCGTVCCMAGAIRMFERQGKTYKKGSPKKMLEDIFETEKDPQLGKLFLGFNDERNINLESIRPKHAAKALMSYIKTGQVTWPKNTPQHLRY